MHFKMIIVFVEDTKTDAVMDAARDSGATGATVIHNARGEGLKVSKTFFGLSLETQRDVILFLVEEHLSRQILEEINRAGELDAEPGTGIAFQVDEKQLALLNRYKMDIAEASGEKHHQLPVPAVFVVDTEGTIVFSYVNPQYSVRLHPDVILAAAKAAL